jgi:hypothetical protein
MERAKSADDEDKDKAADPRLPAGATLHARSCGAVRRDSTPSSGRGSSRAEPLAFIA